MSARSLAIVRELWRWREQEAEHRGRIPKRILRDDLLVEVAKRQTADPKRMRAVRGMERGAFEVRVQWWFHPVYHAAVLAGSARRRVATRLAQRIPLDF